MNSQKLRRKYSTLAKALTYFSILSDVNSLGLTNKQLEVLAWAATEGEFHENDNANRFISHFRSTEGALDSVLWKLKKRGLMVKEGKHLLLLPALNTLDFTQPVSLQINLDNE